MRNARLLPPLLLCLLLLPAAARAGARLEVDAPVNLFLDRSLILFSPNEIRRQGDGRPPSPLLFEAQVAPNLFFPQLHVGELRAPAGQWLLSAVLTPHIRLRMLNESSSPVIPPSFMPKLTLQLLHLRLLPQSPDGNRRALALGTHLVVGHYSNGQQGCFYANQSGVDPDCAPAQGQLPLNELSGDFSTNFVRGEVHARLVLGLDPAAESAWALGGSAGVELNSGLGPGGITRQQRAVYGDGSYQLQLQGERHWHGHRAHAAVSLSQPFGGLPGQGVTVTPELSLSPRWAAGFGLYARYVHGRDYYNILFLEPVRLWQFGLVFELGPGTRLREAVMQQRPHSP